MDVQHVIIGGTTKAATTSLFEYLCSHPLVCGSKFKESRFFLDEEYPLERKINYGGIDQYNLLFDNCISKPIRLEATPDYLYSTHTHQKIKSLLPQAKLIFIVREPISRMISWYNFARQNNELSAAITFDEFVAHQHKLLPGYKFDQHYMALEHGKYAQYLRPYYQSFSKENILILFYEDLSKNPLTVMKEVCCFIGINDAFFDTFNFQVYNKTQNLKSPAIHKAYRSTKRGFRKLLPKNNFLGKWLRKKNKQVEPLYLKMNKNKKATEVILSESIRFFLNSYYTGQKEALENLCGKKVNW